jgi:hypothetical protein
MPSEQRFLLTPKEIKELESLKPENIFPEDNYKRDKLELRIAALLEFREHTSVRRVAAKLGVPVKTLYHWRDRYRVSGLNFLVSIPNLAGLERHDPNATRRIDPHWLRSRIKQLVDRQGHNRFSMNQLSYLIEVSETSLKRYKKEWRDLIQSPQHWKVKK